MTSCIFVEAHVEKLFIRAHVQELLQDAGMYRLAVRGRDLFSRLACVAMSATHADDLTQFEHIMARVRHNSGSAEASRPADGRSSSQRRRGLQADKQRLRELQHKRDRERGRKVLGCA
jgi:hypothetical protein